MLRTESQVSLQTPLCEIGTCKWGPESFGQDYLLIHILEALRPNKGPPNYVIKVDTKDLVCKPRKSKFYNVYILGRNRDFH